MRRDKHHTHSGTQTPRQRQTGRQSRPAPHTHAPTLEDLPQPLTPDFPALLTTPEHMGAGGRQGALQPYQIHIPGSQATDLGKEGLRGGTLHILVSLADSCSSLV